VQVLEAGGLPIGVLEEASYEQATLRLEPGDRLYLFSDGITETQNDQGNMFGIERLMQSLAASRQWKLDESLNQLWRQLEAWNGSPKLDDDVSLLALEVNPWAQLPAVPR
jgi:sigma-B regulation protein RsbU (phosphoserine phosphatase)